MPKITIEVDDFDPTKESIGSGAMRMHRQAKRAIAMHMRSFIYAPKKVAEEPKPEPPASAPVPADTPATRKCDRIGCHKAPLEKYNYCEEHLNLNQHAFPRGPKTRKFMEKGGWPKGDPRNKE